MGRVLDFPLMGTYDKHERILYSQLDNGPATLSFGSSGLPYPSLTCMTDQLTFALHQKFTNIFDENGTPIFELVFQMLQNCSTHQEVIQFLKKSRSLTCWGFYMGFKNGDILSVDIASNHLHYKLHHALDNKIHYFCNELQDPILQEKKFQPLGLNHYNKMRSHIAHLKIEKSIKGPKFYKNDRMETLIMLMGGLLKQSNTKPSKWCADPLTPSSIQIVCMSPHSEKALYIPGPSPKHFKGEVLSIEHSFKRPQITLKKIARPHSKSDCLWKGQQSLMSAQLAFHNKETALTYHHLQMAKLHFKDRPESIISTFFFCVIQYIYEPHPKIQSNLLTRFKHLKNKLPPYLRDHTFLFIARLEIILTQKTSISINDIKSEHLKSIFNIELKINPLFLHKLTAPFINPRIDLLDIIYLHLKLY